VGYPFVSSAHDLGPAAGPRLGVVWHMAEGGGTVAYLHKPNPNGVSVHFVVEYTGRIVQMLALGHMHSSIRTSEIRRTNDTPYTEGDELVMYGRAAALAALGKWSDISHGTLGPNHATIAVEVEGFAVEGPNDRQAIAIEALAQDLELPSSLGHRDFAAYKACPGHHFPWPAIGGHGPRRDPDMAQLPITDQTPKTITLTDPATFYGLDGKVSSSGHHVGGAWLSPYAAAGGFRAMYAGPPPVRLILVKPATIVELPPAGDVKHSVALSIDGAKAYEVDL
jgi:N-acetyl-anhydromuramyl-L-alanine amidase AmpD